MKKQGKKSVQLSVVQQNAMKCVAKNDPYSGCGTMIQCVGRDSVLDGLIKLGLVTTYPMKLTRKGKAVLKG